MGLITRNDDDWAPPPQPESIADLIGICLIVIVIAVVVYSALF